MSLISQKAAEPPKDTGDVLLQEIQFLTDRRSLPRAAQAPASITATVDEHPSTTDKLASFYQQVHQVGNVSALCLSGGGIRSAAFGLGILQGLASRGLLEKIDYLSTVSGGGYIGSLFSAWVSRANLNAVIEQIRSGQLPNPSSPLAYLRRYSRYLTPQSGVLSADSLTVCALYLRNLILNWLVLLPVFVIALALIKIIAAAIWMIDPKYSEWIAISALCCSGIGITASARQRPGWETKRAGRYPFFYQEMVPLILSGAIGGAWTIKYIESANSSDRVIWNFVGVGFLVFVIAWLIAAFFSFAFDDDTNVEPKGPSTAKNIRSEMRDGRYRYVIWTFAVYALSGGVVGLTLALQLLITKYHLSSSDIEQSVLIAAGPVSLMLAFFVGELFYSAFNSVAPWADAEREWLARAGGSSALAAFSWAIFATLVLLGSQLVFIGSSHLFGLEHHVQWTAILSGSSGGIAGIIAALLARTPRTAAQLEANKRSWTDRAIGLILATATPLFIANSTILTSALIDYGIAGKALTPEQAAKSLPELLALVALQMAICAVCSWFVNINRFSMHNVYRNRLIRTFLGASNPTRRPSPFTDFDDRDNIYLDQLKSSDAPGKSVPPLHVINMALNVVGSKNLAWQERKALSFSATPVWVGSGELEWQDEGQIRRRGCFRPTSEYGSKMSLGTAMAISGAAASPNMGYHSSPWLSLVLTFFNVRLGAWYGNPGPAGRRTFKRAGPIFAAGALLDEALGLTTETRKYVYLSDGGHFENLGIYEMLRRRCRYIIASDAGCDPQCSLEDLGSLVRKASIDFGIKIEFESLNVKARSTPPAPGVYCGVAQIIYPEMPDQPGRLLYIKPAFFGNEPASVRSYASQHPEFPHESTANQWFGESQFEAYRALGEHVMSCITGAAGMTPTEIGGVISAAAAQLD